MTAAINAVSVADIFLCCRPINQSKGTKTTTRTAISRNASPSRRAINLFFSALSTV